MIAGVFGLIGVVIGALTTGGTQLFLDRRREREAHKRAFRLVAAELALLEVSYRAVVGTKGILPNYEGGFPLPTAAWEQSQSALASVLDEGLFTELALAYGSVVIERERLRIATSFPVGEEPSKALAEMALDLVGKAHELRQLRKKVLARERLL